MDDRVVAPLEGTILDGRYRVDRLVAEGGFGRVYMGLHLALGAPIAIKVLRYPPGQTDEQRVDALTGFVDEARVIMLLRHEHIVRTLDQGVLPVDAGAAAVPYLVMEWCGEQSLKTILEARRGVPMPVAEAYAIMSPIVDAAAHAHAQGIAHRDLKPSNVMMLPRPSGPGFTPRIIDFGIAKLFDRTAAAGTGDTKTRSDSTPFTPAYAAPEQIAGARTGPWTDVHALGLLLVELIAGEPPLGSASGASMAAIDPTRPTPRSFGIDAGTFESVIAKAVSLRPGDRHRDAGELAAALREAATNMELAVVPPPHSRARSVPPTARSRVAVGLAAVVFVAASVSVAVVALSRGDRASSTTASSATPGIASSSATPSSSASSSASAAPASPKAKLAELSRASLEERAVAAGFEVANVTGGEDPRGWYQVNYVIDGVRGELFWNDVEPGPGDQVMMPALETIRAWTISDRERGFELAYAIKDNVVLSMSFHAAGVPSAVKAFDEIARQFDVDVRGNSATGPDPATDPEDSRVTWVAKRLQGINNLELFYRLGTTGVGARVGNKKPGEVPFLLERGSDRGVFELFDGSNRQALDRYLSDRRARKVHFCWAEDELAAVTVEGTGELTQPKFLAKVLDGLPSTVVCEP